MQTKYSEECMDTGEHSHWIPQITEQSWAMVIAHSTLLQQVQVFVMKINTELLTFEKEEGLKRNIKGNKTPLLTVHVLMTDSLYNEEEVGLCIIYHTTLETQQNLPGL